MVTPMVTRVFIVAMVTVAMENMTDLELYLPIFVMLNAISSSRRVSSILVLVVISSSVSNRGGVAIPKSWGIRVKNLRGDR